MPCTVYEIPYDRDLANKINALNLDIESRIAKASVVTDILREQVLSGSREVTAWNFTPFTEDDVEKLVEQANALESKLSPPYTAPMPRIDRERLAILAALGEEWRELLTTPPEKLDRAGIAETQKGHRKQDIQRLIHHFTAAGDLTMVAKLASVDLNRPLEPQLGFNPDDF